MRAEIQKLYGAGSTNVTFIDIQTGAWNTIPIDVSANIVPRTQVTTKGQGKTRRSS